VIPQRRNQELLKDRDGSHNFHRKRKTRVDGLRFLVHAIVDGMMIAVIARIVVGIVIGTAGMGEGTGFLLFNHGLT
jgi:hypothetical protein